MVDGRGHVMMVYQFHTSQITHRKSPITQITNHRNHRNHQTPNQQSHIENHQSQSTNHTNHIRKCIHPGSQFDSLISIPSRSL